MLVCCRLYGPLDMRHSIGYISNATRDSLEAVATNGNHGQWQGASLVLLPSFRLFFFFVFPICNHHALLLLSFANFFSIQPIHGVSCTCGNVEVWSTTWARVGGWSGRREDADYAEGPKGQPKRILTLQFLISHGVLGNKTFGSLFSLELRSSKATNSFSRFFLFPEWRWVIFAFFFSPLFWDSGKKKRKKKKKSESLSFSCVANAPLPEGSSIGFLFCFGRMGRGWERDDRVSTLHRQHAPICIKGTLFCLPCPDPTFCYCFGCSNLSSFLFPFGSLQCNSDNTDTHICTNESMISCSPFFCCCCC